MARHRQLKSITPADIVLPRSKFYATAPRHELMPYREMAAELVSRMVQCHKQGGLIFAINHAPKDFHDYMVVILVTDLAMKTIEARQVSAPQLVIDMDTSGMPPAELQQAEAVLKGRLTLAWSDSL